MDNNELYVLLLEHLIKASGNKPLIDLAKICKAAPDVALKYLDVPLVELEIRSDWEKSVRNRTAWIHCVKKYRALTGKELREAREAVDRILSVNSEHLK